MKSIILKNPQCRNIYDVVKSGYRFVSYKTGIIKAILEQPIEQDDPYIFSFGTVMNDTSRFSKHKCSVRNGGAGLTREKALLATIGEAIERYCSSFYNRENLIFGSYIEHENYAVHPNNFILFSDKQYYQENFPFKPFTAISKIYWTWGYSLIYNKPKLVPACFTYLPYGYTKEETFLGPSISTGLSCGNSLEEAILTGIYECIERDAFTIMWLNKLSMPVVKIDENKNQIGKIIHDKFVISNIDYYVCDITSDIGIPTFYVLAIGNSSDGMLACVGSATRLNSEDAILKALVESAQGRPYLRYVLRKDPNWTCGENFCNLRSFDDHGRLYSSMPELIPKLLFIKQPASRLLRELPNLSSSKIVDDIKFCLKKLSGMGLDVIVIDLTTRDVKEVGFSVVRVIIPGLHPLHGNHQFRFLGGNRLYNVPRILGYTQKDTTEEELYAWPHPFP
ncbi:MAG: YcaO-like family protein [Candidatus Thorarchaeota archaeon]